MKKKILVNLGALRSHTFCMRCSIFSGFISWDKAHNWGRPGGSRTGVFARRDKTRLQLLPHFLPTRDNNVPVTDRRRKKRSMGNTEAAASRILCRVAADPKTDEKSLLSGQKHKRKRRPTILRERESIESKVEEKLARQLSSMIACPLVQNAIKICD